MNAIGELYDGHHQRIFRYIWSRTRHRQLAEDLTGETFARMVEHLPTYQDQNLPFRAWLYRIAHNLVIDHFRREDGRSTLPLYVAENVSANHREPTAVVERQLTVERVQQALETIDPAQREVILLRFVAGLPLQEVALSLDKSVAAVKSLQHRGLKALRTAVISSV